MFVTETKKGGIRVSIPVTREKGFSAVTKMTTHAAREIVTKHGTLKRSLLGCECEKCSVIVKRSKQVPLAIKYLEENFSEVSKSLFKKWLNTPVDKSYSTKYIDVFELDFPKFRALANSKFADFDQVSG